MNRSIDDLQGRTFGLLRVIGAAQRPANNRSKHTYLLCECACRRIVRASRSNLVGGKVRSCGVCIRRNYAAQQLPSGNDGAATADALIFRQVAINR